MRLPLNPTLAEARKAINVVGSVMCDSPGCTNPLAYYGLSLTNDKRPSLVVAVVAPSEIDLDADDIANIQAGRAVVVSTFWASTRRPSLTPDVGRFRGPFVVALLDSEGVQRTGAETLDCPRCGSKAVDYSTVVWAIRQNRKTVKAR